MTTAVATAPAPAFVALGFDPGLVATGYGALAAGPRGAVLREAGVIRPRPQRSFEHRILEIYRETHVVLEEIGPDVIVLEDVFMHPRFPQSAITLAHVRGVLCVAAAERGVPVESLTPAAVKRAVSGNGRAPKAQMQGVVQRLLRISGSPSAHAADALALAIAALSRRGYPLAEPGRRE